MESRAGLDAVKKKQIFDLPGIEPRSPSLVHKLSHYTVPGPEFWTRSTKLLVVILFASSAIHIINCVQSV